MGARSVLTPVGVEVGAAPRAERLVQEDLCMEQGQPGTLQPRRP